MQRTNSERGAGRKPSCLTVDLYMFLAFLLPWLTCRRRPVKSSCETKNRRDLHPAHRLPLIELESGLGGITLRIPLEELPA